MKAMKIGALTRKNLWTAWLYAVLWNGSFGLLGCLILRHSNFKEASTLPALMFLLIGFGFLAFAFRESVRWHVYGQTFFISDADGFLLGGSLKGKIERSSNLRASLGRRFCLSLISLVDSKIERRTYTLRRDKTYIEVAFDGTIPVLFSLPAEISRNRLSCVSSEYPIIWKLRVKGVDGGFFSFAAEYIVPVVSPSNENAYIREPL
jgi:hypothetical protein